MGFFMVELLDFGSEKGCASAARAVDSERKNGFAYRDADDSQAPPPGQLYAGLIAPIKGAAILCRACRIRGSRQRLPGNSAVPQHAESW
jgi:hypothetical protein